MLLYAFCPKAVKNDNFITEEHEPSSLLDLDNTLNISANRMMINYSTLEYHVTNFNTFFRWLWRKNQNPNTLP